MSAKPWPDLPPVVNEFRLPPLECGAESSPSGPMMLRCTLPRGHDGYHRQEGTPASWTRPAPPNLPPVGPYGWDAPNIPEPFIACIWQGGTSGVIARRGDCHAHGWDVTASGKSDWERGVQRLVDTGRYMVQPDGYVTRKPINDRDLLADEWADHVRRTLEAGADYYHSDLCGCRSCLYWRSSWTVWHGRDHYNGVSAAADMPYPRDRAIKP